MPRSTWDLRRYFWAPRLGMRGIFRLTVFRDVTVVSGSGVGGGSLGYANTLYRAPERFYADPQWSGLEDWAAALAPHYDTAERMLGVVTVEADDPADQLLREFGREIGADRTLRQDARRRLLRHAGRDRRRPVLRRGGPGAHRLHRLRALHGRLPVQREEHAAQELPVARRARGRDDHARTAPSSTSARWAPTTASDGYAVTTEATGRVAAPRPARAHGARRGRRGRRARHEPAARRRAADRLAAARSPRGWASSCGRTRRRSSPSRSRATRPT